MIPGESNVFAGPWRYPSSLRRRRIAALLTVGLISFLFGACSDRAIEPDPPPPPPGAVVWGVLGDSQTDEYQGDDHRGPPTVINWLELLVRTRDLNVGRWSDASRGEPRRSGFEFNWARSGAVMADVLEDQLDGLVRQIERGFVTHAVLFSTGNEWVNRSPFLMPTIYASTDGVTDGSGTAISARVDMVAGQITAVMDALAEAVMASEAQGGVVIMTPPDYVLHPGVIAAMPDSLHRAYVSRAVADIHSAVLDRANAINSAAGRTVVSVIPTDSLLAQAWATADGQFITAAGVQLDYSRDSQDGDPHFVAIAPSASSAHMGTIGGGLFARAFVEAANRLPGVTIQQLTDQEIREAAGIRD